MSCCRLARDTKVHVATEEGEESAGDDEIQSTSAVNSVTKKELDMNMTSGGPWTAENRPIGMSLQCIYKFLSDHPDVRDEELTTSAINKKHIKKETKGTNQAYIYKYVGERDDNGKPFVSTATTFVSHAWKYSFTRDVLDCLEQYESLPVNNDSYYWFDLFTNDQNDLSEKDYDWFSQTFRSSILYIGKVLLVMSPWDKPKPLTRAWCLLEIASSLEMTRDVIFRAELPRSQIESMVNGVRSDPDCIIQVLADIQAEKAEATVQSDKDTIFQTIQDTTGFQAINQRIKNFLRNWYILTLGRVVYKAESEKKDELLTNVGNVMETFGELDLALKYYQMALDIQLNTLGDNHPDIGIAYNNVGGVYKGKGEYDKALEYYRKDLTITLSTRGNNHPDTAASYVAVAEVYYEKGDYDKALEYNQIALDLAMNTLDENDLIKAGCYLNIGGVHDGKGEYDKAIESFQMALDIQLRTLGINNPDTASSYQNMGVVYYRKEEYDKALEHFQKSFDIRSDILGEHHPDTRMTYQHIEAVNSAHQSKGV